MLFDAYAALRKLDAEPVAPAAIPTKPPENAPNVAIVADVAGVQARKPEKALGQNQANPDADAFEERAAICEYDGGLTRDAAEDLAAQCQGYDNVIAFRAALMGKREPTK